MIGKFDVVPPPFDEGVAELVESCRELTGQDYAAVLVFGLWGGAEDSPALRLYAGYRHLEKSPGDGPAWLETARVHAEMGDAAAARHILDELLRLGSPGLFPQLFAEDPEAEKAKILADANEPDKALELLEGMRDRHGDTPAYQYLRASLLHETGDFPAAVAAYETTRALLEAASAEGDPDGETPDYAAALRLVAAVRDAAAAGAPFAGPRPFDPAEFDDGA